MEVEHECGATPAVQRTKPPLPITWGAIEGRKTVMKPKILNLSALLALLLALAACGAKASPTSADIILVPFASERFGLSGVVPEGWSEVEPGILVRGTASDDVTQLIIQSFPDMTSDWAVTALVLPPLGLETLPESVGSIDSATLTWVQHTVDAELPDMGRVVVDLALADGNAGVYVVALVTGPDDYDTLHEMVFLPAVKAIELAAHDRRDRLVTAELMDVQTEGQGPVHNVYFMPIGESAPALHTLEGTLTVPEFRIHRPAPPGQVVRSSDITFPGFSVEFFTYEEHLVPTVRDVIPSSAGQSRWRIILSPGQIWSEPQDGGMSRASFPFLLSDEFSNEAHNGIATFLYDDAQVSSFRFQVVQETCPWNRTDYWGQSAMDYLPHPLEDRDALAIQFAEELRLRIPIRPWSELVQKYGADLVNTFSGPIPALDISTTGLVLDGAIYLQPCFTRYGAFPYCHTMRHGVFSVTKSMGAGVAMLRLAEKCGENVFELKIADYVEVTADHDGWDEVTFGDALNQATGIGDKADLKAFTGEEDDAKFSRFMEARSAQEKLEVCFSYGDYPWGPGEVARYNSINTFVLSVAMDRFLKGQEGPDADIWDMVVEEVYHPIGVLYAPIMRTTEPDGSRGIPIFGYGLYPTVDDVAKVAELYHHGGQHQGQQLLHAGKLAEALYQVEDIGFPTGDRNQQGDVLYSLSFWSVPYRTSTGSFFQVPYMSGFGGNHVALMPNGMTAFRFSDAHVYGVETMVKVADGITPFPTP
jgi:hypothetical protein